MWPDRLTGSFRSDDRPEPSADSPDPSWDGTIAEVEAVARRHAAEDDDVLSICTRYGEILFTGPPNEVAAFLAGYMRSPR
jgi:hypothetical protein